jgi:hypothetical protein
MTVRITHQVARDPRNLSPYEQKSRDLLSQHNPGWEHAIYGDDDLLALAHQHYQPLADAWDRLKGIQKADLGRYLALWVRGGVYADTDLYVSAPFADFGISESPDGPILLAPSAPVFPGGQMAMTNYVMASPRPGHPFWKDVIDTSLEKIARRSKPSDTRKIAYVSDTTGRNMISGVARRYPGQVELFPFARDMGCPHTCATGALAVHTGMLTSGKQASWIEKTRVGLARTECTTREALGVRGDLCQSPFVLGMIMIIVVVAVALGLGLGLGLRRKRLRPAPVVRW